LALAFHSLSASSQQATALSGLGRLGASSFAVEGPSMHPLLASVPTLAVSAIFCIWHAYQKARLRKERILRERVAYMLWVMANRIH
jgi:hypothetical protein